MHDLDSDGLVEQLQNHLPSSFTSFTFRFEPKVNNQTDRQQLGVTLLFTSFTSFSKGRVMWASEGERERAPLFFSPFRRTSERGEQEEFTPSLCGDLPVHFSFSAEVNKPLSFTSVGVAS
jgi:hypothetical protein